MIKLEKTETYGWEAAIRGMRNPMNSWHKSDSKFNVKRFLKYSDDNVRCFFDEMGCPFLLDGVELGPNDLDLARRLAKGGPVHAKYRRQIFVSVDITAPLYWWKEFDTYKVGTTANSCSTMHKIHAKEFTREDFSCERLLDSDDGFQTCCDHCGEHATVTPVGILNLTIDTLNHYRGLYLLSRDKKYWHQMIQLLPSSYNQKRTVTMTYENLYNMYHSRKDHRLDEWRVGFCEWAKSLPYSELFTMEWEEKKK